MKFFVVALSLVAICSATQDDVDEDDKFTKDCADGVGITTEESYNYDRNAGNFINDPKALIYFKCLFQKLGWIDQNGDFQESVVIERLTIYRFSTLTEEQVKQCTATAGDNKANTFPIKLASCYLEGSSDQF